MIRIHARSPCLLFVRGLLLLTPTIALAAPVPGSGSQSTITIATPAAGEMPLVIEGRVFAPDGETPAPGVVVYAYQTGKNGLYHPPGERLPRIRGWAETDAEGRFEIRTIRPGSYPNSRISAHVHFQAWGGGYEAQWNEDLLFSDDPNLSTREKDRAAGLGEFGGICAVPAGASLSTPLVCQHRLRLKPTGDRFEASIRHGLDGPPAKD